MRYFTFQVSFISLELERNQTLLLLARNTGCCLLCSQRRQWKQPFLYRPSSISSSRADACSVNAAMLIMNP